MLVIEATDWNNFHHRIYAFTYFYTVSGATLPYILDPLRAPSGKAYVITRDAGVAKNLAIFLVVPLKKGITRKFSSRWQVGGGLEQCYPSRSG